LSRVKFHSKGSATAFLGQPAEGEVYALLRRGQCAIPGPYLSEVVEKLVRKHALELGSVSERLNPLIDELLPVAPVDRRIAWRAGELRAEHYHRKTAALSLPDCILLASAGRNDEIASSAGAVVDVARKLEIDVIASPASDGRPPTGGA
jgi:PIN domain